MDRIGASLILTLAALLAFALWRTHLRLARTNAERKELERSARIFEQERHVLELIARGASLKEVLTALTLAVENIVPGVQCSVLLVDRKRGCLAQGAAPHLPPEYWRLCEGLPIVKDLGCCPAAAFDNKTVISEDIATDARWAPVRDMVLGFGLRSCWSVPISDSETQRVIGTFAMYRPCPAKPTSFDLRAVQAGAQLAGNAIERLRNVKNLSEYAERFSMAERTAGFGIWSWDPASGLFELSDGAAKIAGFGPAGLQVTGQQLNETVPVEDREPARVARESAFLSGGAYEHEFRRIAPDGSTRWFHNRGAVELADGKPAKVVGAIIDITEHKDLLCRLELAKSAAEEAFRVKSEFLANMSHEIRTPMNAVSGMTSLLLDLDLPAEAVDYVQTIQTASASLLTIINDILDLSKIDSGKLELDHVPFSLRDCLEEGVELLAASASGKGLNLAVDMPPSFAGWIYGDRARLRQVLVNLAGNAVKFTQKGEIVIAVSESVAAGRGTLVIAVRDTGIGIPPEKQDRLFQSFSQVDPSITRRFGGTGLGLCISRHLVELMGGTLSVESAVGVGSTFTLTLPHDPAPALEPPLSALPGWAGQRVLVAESDATNRRILAAMLSRWTLTVQTVPSVAEALGRLRAEPWDLVILNRQLPGVEDAGPFAVGNDGTASARSVPDGRIGPVAVRISTPIRSKCLHRTLSQALGGGAPAEIAASLLDPGLAQRMPLRILVADDNPVNQRVAGRLLERWGYHPGLACNGLEVLEAVRNHCYDLVLLDVQMPEMDGIEAARRICAEMPPGRRPRIIALTAGVFKQDRERCMEAGMDGFLSKPIVVGELKAALEQCFVKLLPSAPPTDSPPPRRYARIQVS